MQTLIIRVEESAAPGAGFPVRGLIAATDGTAEIGQVRGKIPWPLPPIDDTGSDPVAAIHDAMLASGDPALRPDEGGRYLWRLLAGKEIGSWWQQLAGNAVPGTVRTVLDVRASRLKPLPWELLTHEPDGYRPFQSSDNPWARAEGPGATAEDISTPISVLAVVGNPRDPKLQVDDELDAIVGALRDAYGRWDVEVLPRPSPKDLRGMLKDFRPHVLHIITHGTVTASGAVLVMPGERDAWELTTADIPNLLPLPPPRLVVLNACRSAAGGRGHPMAWSFADAFLRRGCGAVVTMQGNIPSRAAIPFSAAFYQELVNSVPVDAAAARGREAIYDALKTEKDERSWAMPSLYLRLLPDRVLPIRPAVTVDAVRQPPYNQAYDPVGGYVDRTNERWQLLTQLSVETGRPRAPMSIVTGKEKAGKTAVVKSTLLACHLGGHQVAYVDLERCAGAPWLTMLRYVRDEVSDWLPHAVKPVRRFDHELAFLKDHREAKRYAPKSARTDDGGDFEYRSPHYRRKHEFRDDRGRSLGSSEALDDVESIDKIFESFRRMLRSIAGERLLVLALDHLQEIDGGDVKDFVLPYLLVPASNGELGYVHLLLTERPGWLKSLRNPDLVYLAGEQRRPKLTLPEPCWIPMFRWDRFDRLGREYNARRNTLPVNTKVRDLLKMFLDNQPPECTGTQLDQALKAIDLLVSTP